jgi:hypothetical protein
MNLRSSGFVKVFLCRQVFFTKANTKISMTGPPSYPRFVLSLSLLPNSHTRSTLDLLINFLNQILDFDGKAKIDIQISLFHCVVSPKFAEVIKDCCIFRDLYNRIVPVAETFSKYSSSVNEH